MISAIALMPSNRDVESTKDPNGRSPLHFVQDLYMIQDRGFVIKL